MSAYLDANVWNEEYYKNGKKFIPERWLLEQEREPFSYLPFMRGRDIVW